ncbi:MAG: ATP-binding cassette, subfamily bacterial [Acidimicrobiaceae bacterium]|nr:ATP-binding cassette, subfamily bacterial [Acidimicrobiaceae bacterium]
MNTSPQPLARRLVIRSQIPGRIRLDAPGLRSNPALASAIEQALTSMAGVRTVTANPTSGTILVHFDPAADLERIEATIRFQIDRHPTATREVPVDQRSLRRVLAVALPDRRVLARPASLTVTAHGLNMAQNLALISTVTVASGGRSRFLRRLGITDTRSQLRVITGASVVLTLGEVWMQHQRGKAWRRASLNAEHDLRTAVFCHLQTQDLSFFDDHGTGVLLNTMTDQVASVGALICGVDGLIESCMMVAISTVALVRTSPRLALIAAAAIPIAVLPARLLGAKAEQAFSEVAEPAAGFTQGLENILTGIVEVKSFTAEPREALRVEHLSADSVSALQSASSAALLQTTVVKNVLYLTAAAMFWQAARQVVAARVPVAKLTRAVYWIPQLMGAIGATAQSAATYYGADAAANRLATVLDATANIRSGPLRARPDTIRGQVLVEDLTFGYDPERPVLRGISFELPAGATLGIVGPTGSGKSTLLRLLLRFYEPDVGRILLDGRDIRQLDLTDLRSAIALVSQEVYLFDDSLAANLRYGRPDATIEQIDAALAASAATDVVDALPGGLNAQVGERGHRLSGGQRQRLALARALLKDSPVLALDEATSHLDYASEAAIKASLKTAAAHKTIILIAHRLSSVRDADHIIVLDHGAIREQGSHQSLLDQEGLYHHLWQLQS